MTMLVTGASGGLGRALLPRLSRRKEDLRLLSRRARPSAGGRTRWIEGDLCDPLSVARAVEGSDTILHLAAVTHSRRGESYFRVNAEGTRCLVREAERARVGWFFHVSTRALGPSGGAYSHSKDLAEEAVRRSRLSWVVLRPAEIYGVGERDPILGLARSLERRSFVWILGDGSATVCPVHVEDVAHAVERALERRESGRTYVLAGPEELSLLELVQRCERILGLPPRRRVHVPWNLARLVVGVAGRLGLGPYVPDQLPRLGLTKQRDISAAVRDLDFAPRSLDEVLPALLRAGHAG